MLNKLEASVRDAPPLFIIDLHGEMTTFAQEPLAQAYQDASKQAASTILLNFTGVDYLNSAGLAAVIGIISQARQANQRIFLTGLTAHYQLVFEMMGLTAYAPLFESEEAARAAVERA